MSKYEKIGQAAIDYFELGDSLESVYEAIYNYSESPNPETAGKPIGIISSQVAGQLIGNFIDKIVPHEGQDFLWVSLKGQFDNPQSMEDKRATRKRTKAAFGVFIGVYIENRIEAAAHSELLQDNFFQYIFPYYDAAADTADSFLNWWDPLGTNRAMDVFNAPTKEFSVQEISNAQPNH